MIIDFRGVPPRMKLRIAAVVVGCCVDPCSEGRAFTRGQYEDPNTIEMLSDGFNENDLQLIAKKMVDSMLMSPVVSSFLPAPSS